MLKGLLVLFLLLIIQFDLRAQKADEWFLSGGVDLYRTNNYGFVKKVQAGVEANYFLINRFSLTCGADIWQPGPVSFVVGGRIYPSEHFLLRGRGFINLAGGDFAAGAGYTYQIVDKWNLEPFVDYYFIQKEFAIRIMITYVLKN